MKKHLITLLTALVLLSCLPVSASAKDVPKPGKPGSITVTMRSGSKIVAGGELTAYRVGRVADDGDYNYSFVPTGVFTDWGTDFGDLNSAEQSAKTAESLASHVKNHKITGVKKTVGKDGKVTFPDLEQGLYLLVQTKAASGYSAVNPFLVSVPYLKDGRYIYEVDATSKTELEPQPSTTPGNPSTPGEKLPQTGQLWWPVPVLLAAGLLFVVLGLVKRRGSGHGE
ncbi:hypothetical protein MR626_05620 [bacterium]|nr:hypothetical protein [bacterium]